MDIVGSGIRLRSRVYKSSSGTDTLSSYADRGDKESKMLNPPEHSREKPNRNLRP
jgi:hypothetical protein